jgi:trans-aconitate methyltransferase
VVTYLNAQPSDRILDVGCGDGILTSQIAANLSSAGQIIGLDSSPSMINTAKEAYPNVRFEVQDCTKLRTWLETNDASASFDRIFSNAAYHWILRQPSTRRDVFRDAYQALKPNGYLVFEMGGFGNVSEVHAACIAALVAHGIDIEAAREACPWFFPSDKWMRQMLEDVGFDVEKVEVEYRPTKLTEDKEGGLPGWVKLMAAQFLEVVNEQKRDEVARWIVNILETISNREDGSSWLNYVRLRAVARKK